MRGEGLGPGLTAASLALYTGTLPVCSSAASDGYKGQLMISILRYPSLEQLAFDAPIPIRIVFVTIFVLALARPGDFLFVLPLSYISYGLVANLIWTLRTPKTA